jgi:hypothetical protein
MQLKFAAAVVAATLAWPAGMGARELSVRTQQADPQAKIAAAANLDNAQTYFDRARKLGFPAASGGAPYILRAEFTTRASSGVVETGSYTDTWVSDSKWRREAVLGNSRFVRARNGKKRYRLGEGPDAALLQFVLTAMEPIPATDSVKNSDWKTRPEAVDGVDMIRVARGRESPDGTPDPKQFEGYWFDTTGQLARTFLNALQTRRLDFADFNGMQVARRVEVMLGGKVGMRIDVTALGPAGTVDPHIFVMKGQEWNGQFTSEVR